MNSAPSSESRDIFEFYASCLPGSQQLLAQEMKMLGIKRVRPLQSGVAFFATQQHVYKFLLYSRIAARVTLILARVPAPDADTLYRNVASMNWCDIIAPGTTIAVKAAGTHQQLRNTHFTALKVKDAIVDTLRATRSQDEIRVKRSHEQHVSSAKRQICASIDVRLRDNRATLSLDVSGGTLGRRFYLGDVEHDKAPLETLVAAALAQCVCNQTHARTFIDPCAYSASFIFEALCACLHMPLHAYRTSWGVRAWALHDSCMWSDLQQHAQCAYAAAVQQFMDDVQAKCVRPWVILCTHTASQQRIIKQLKDAHLGALVACGAVACLMVNPMNIQRSLALLNPQMYADGNYDHDIALASCYALSSLRTQASTIACQQLMLQCMHHVTDSLCVATLDDSFVALCTAQLETARGRHKPLLSWSALQEHAANHSAAEQEHAAHQSATDEEHAAEQALTTAESSAVSTTAIPLASVSALELSCAHQKVSVSVIEHVCSCLPGALYQVSDTNGGAAHPVYLYEEGSLQFAQRLIKLLRERRKFARTCQVANYRLYDADLPEFSLAIDVYSAAQSSDFQQTPEQLYLHISEYAPARCISPIKAARRFADAVYIASCVCNVPVERIFIKTRIQEKGGAQYSNAGAAHEPCVRYIRENDLIFEVDLASKLDTGIFLDHRITRQLVEKHCTGARFLNLFGYTGSASVYAARGGAHSTTTVDLSQRYLEWADRNMYLNDFEGSQHLFERGDVMRWLTDARRSGKRFDFIFVDPPTFSNSKAMGRRTWDVQRDHVELLIGVSRLLSENGRALFSCNLRSFKLNEQQLKHYGVDVRCITDETIPLDFARNKKIHHCYWVYRIAQH